MPLSMPTTDGLPAAAPPPARRGRRGVVGLRALGVLAVVAVIAVGWTSLRSALGGVTAGESCAATVDGTTTSLDPEQAGNAATITAVAVARGLPARAATIGLATALQESKLRNLDHGDRDSLGLFQQRPSAGWGTPAQVRDPVYAANAFYDVLVKIEGYKTAPITQAAQKVQRSGYPGAYAQREEEARVLASTLSGYSPGAFTCNLKPVTGAVVQQPGAGGYTPRAAAVVAAAKREAGHAPAPGPADSTGTTVRYVLTGTQARRLGWGLAHWSVARAAALDVVAVRTDGLQWRREAPGRGWTAPAGSAAPVPAGTVEIVVAEGDK